ncbi:methyltransferase [Streptomyces inhibens]|uniref:methyltransferase n=1 Tax=Streptomyces inhibens TaxID=2293571 RepID=UPI001EE75918|nr:methyltransferase [Streptomyces inhibens]UKY51784.1 methyltransferase [Streptomyces inhibens]
MTAQGAAIPPAVSRLRELALAAAGAAAVRAAARLGVADALGDSPATVAELAAATHTEPDTLARLLRALACREIFAETEDGRFTHTESSLLLREDAQRSLKYTSLWATEPWTWTLWGHLDEAVRTGKNVFDELYGMDFFTYLHTDADGTASAKIFDKAMTQSSQLSARNIADALDLSGARRVVDIAGGQGLVLATLLEKYPELSGTLLELPNVIGNVDSRLAEGGSLAGRTELVPGDCRYEIPVRADVYVLKNVLEWDDDSTIGTLRQVAAAAEPGARVLVIENIIDGSSEAGFTTAMDMLLLLNVGGRKHTLDGLTGLIEKSGLTVGAVTGINSYLQMIEATVPG